MRIAKSNLDFLKELQENNNRQWFNENKDRYLQSLQNTIEFTDSLISEMSRYDRIETPSGKKSLFRIYRDVRFSKDKSPYKSYWGGRMKRATPYRRGGYYFQIEPGNSFAAGGFWRPDPSDLDLIRRHIAQDDTQLREVLADKMFKKIFRELEGEKVKTIPKGYTKDHPAADLLRFKQFIVYHRFTDKEILSQDFLKMIVEVYLTLHPFFDYMSEILTTDLNGISLID